MCGGEHVRLEGKKRERVRYLGKGRREKGEYKTRCEEEVGRGWKRGIWGEKNIILYLPARTHLKEE